MQLHVFEDEWIADYQILLPAAYLPPCELVLGAKPAKKMLTFFDRFSFLQV